MRYYALIDGGPGAYGVVFPDLPGCTAMGATVEQTMAAASEALADWVSTVESIGRPVPRPKSADDLRRDPEVADALAQGACLTYTFGPCA